MKPKIPSIEDRDTLVNLSSSLLSFFGIASKHPRIELINGVLQEKKKVMVLLLDGLGYHVRRVFPGAAASLIAHEIGMIHSVYPPTTVAATTAFLSNQYPKENGYLGWTSAFPDDNYLSFTGLKAADKSCPERKFLPLYESIVDKINKAGFPAEIVYPYPVDKSGPIDFPSLMEKAKAAFVRSSFVYVYWTDPDHAIHDEGLNSPIVERTIVELDKEVDAFAAGLKEEEALLVIADHGLIDIEEFDIAAHPDLCGLLSRGISIEGRTAAFFVNEGKESVFEELFAKYYPEIPLYSRQEMLESTYFGVGEASPLFPSLLGDFIAIPQGDELFIDTCHKKDDGGFKGHHGGISPFERDIGVSLYTSK